MEVIIFIMDLLRQYVSMLMTSPTPISVSTDAGVVTLTWGMFLIGFTVMGIVISFFKKLLKDEVVSIVRRG